MKQYHLWLLTTLIIALLSFHTDAQTKKKSKKSIQKTTVQKKSVVKNKTDTPKKIEAKTSTPAPRKPVSFTEDEKRVRDIISFLQYMLNTLGSTDTPVRDKDVLVTQSYSKIFRDNKVQIEDDLDADRVVITNKDVVPYLKDVEFFFKDVKFDFAVEDIKSNTLPGGEIFYKVSTRRTLIGTTTDGDKVNNSSIRYIEINYDPASQDLRIVSIYTHEINEKAVLTNWWYDLTAEWKNVLISKIPGKNANDSLSVGDIKAITAIQDLDISKNMFIQNLDPLERIHNLKTLNISGSLISNLSPIRNLSELETFKASNTKSTDLTPLKYASKLTNLDISRTNILDISVLEKTALQHLNLTSTPVVDFSVLASLPDLESLNLARTKISNLSPIAELKKVKVLDLSGTLIQDFGALKNLKQLDSLSLDGTRIATLEPIRHLENLSVLSVNSTSISDLLPLQKIANLKTIYADRSHIDQTAVDKLQGSNAKAAVIFDTDNLTAWWTNLTPQWQLMFNTTVKVNAVPTKEELASISQIDSINLKDQHFGNLEPLRKLLKLEVVILANNSVRDLSPIQSHKHIRYLDISETDVTNLAPVSEFADLKVLRADKSKIENIENYAFPSLRFFYADQTSVHDITAREFLEKNPDCLLVYKTVHIHRWWNNLSENWKAVFKAKIGVDTTRESYHKLLEQKTFQIKDAPVADLSALSEFVQLKELLLSGTSITVIPKLEYLQSLTTLRATNSPVQNIDPSALPVSIIELDLSNTPIDDLKVIGTLPNLKTLNCAGTQIKRLDHLAQSPKLEVLDCSNTNVSKLDILDQLSLKTLTCYNTKISNRVIENFKLKHAECNVIFYR